MLSAIVGGASLIEMVDRSIGSTGASGAVGELYARHATALFALCRRLGLDEDEAWDAVQEAHVRLWRVLAEGQEVRDCRAWLAAATYRLAMDQHRFARRVGELRHRLGASSERASGRSVDSTDALAAWAAVDALPVRQRAALYLHYRLDLTYEDVGRAMGISAGAARVSASRGLAAVRAELGVPEEGGVE